MEKLKFSCIKLIEQELNLFFNNYKKCAYSYSLMVANNLKDYNKETFEKAVISSEEIEFLIKDIIIKLEDKIQSSDFLLEKSSFNNVVISNYLDHLNSFISQFKTTQNTLIYSEKIINAIIFKSFSSICTNPIAKFAINKASFGSKLFGNINSKKQKERFQIQISNQIDGILINIHTDIKNLLINNLIKSTNDSFEYIVNTA